MTRVLKENITTKWNVAKELCLMKKFRTTIKIVWIVILKITDFVNMITYSIFNCTTSYVVHNTTNIVPAENSQILSEDDRWLLATGS